MKKILAVMLSMGMALSLFGCQSGGTSERPAESSSKTETEEQTKKEADDKLNPKKKKKKRKSCLSILLSKRKIPTRYLMKH